MSAENKTPGLLTPVPSHRLRPICFVSLLLAGGPQQKHLRLLHDNPPDDEELDPQPVVSLRWDHLSSGYLLVALPTGNLFLLEASGTEIQVVTTYACPSRATTIRMVSWVPGAAGMFVTGGDTCLLDFVFKTVATYSSRLADVCTLWQRALLSMI